MKDHYKWADGGLVRTVVDQKKLALLGEPVASGDKKKKAKVAVVEKPKAEEKKEEEEPTIDIK